LRTTEESILKSDVVGRWDELISINQLNNLSLTFSNANFVKLRACTNRRQVKTCGYLNEVRLRALGK
jgi:hypothetical protein